MYPRMCKCCIKLIRRFMAVHRKATHTVDFAEHSSVKLTDPTIIITRRTFSLVYTTTLKRNYQFDNTDYGQQDSCCMRNYLRSTTGYEYKWKCSQIELYLENASACTCMHATGSNCIDQVQEQISARPNFHQLDTPYQPLAASYLRI